MTQVTSTCSTVNGTTISKDAVCIISIVEEDGELKVLEAKEFADSPEHRAWQKLGSEAPVV